MSHKHFDSFFALEQYPKLFWEPAYQRKITLALGNEPLATTPLFYHGSKPQTFHPAWIHEYPSCELASTKIMPQMIERKNIPEYDSWQQNVEKALQKIDEGSLQKVVLARKTILRFSSRIDPWELFFRLRQRAADSTTRFCLQYGESRAFLGATPEKLFERNGLQLSTMALAGTIGRSSDAVQDAQLASTLLTSAKNRHEIDLVADSIANTLSHFSQSIEIGSLEVLKSTRVQHLHYPIRALLKEGIRDEEIISALHPTPALGGLPRKEALDFIENHEPFTRGPYGAPIGFISPKKTELAVAIRSAYIEGTELHLFAGAGIVSGSKAPDEWQELEQKISPFISLI